MTDPKDPQAELREVVEIIHGDKCPLIKPCPVVNQGIRAIEELFQAHQQELLSELLGELPEMWLADPKYRNLAADKDHSTDYFRALGHDQAIDQVVSVIQSKIGELNG